MKKERHVMSHVATYVPEKPSLSAQSFTLHTAGHSSNDAIGKGCSAMPNIACKQQWLRERADTSVVGPRGLEPS